MKSIYEYHSRPESLYGWGMDDDVPWVALENIKQHGPTPRREQAVAKNADTAFKYAVQIIKGPWPPGEAAIAQNPRYVYEYARDVIKAPWPPGEAAIATNNQYSTLYKRFVASKTTPKTT